METFHKPRQQNPVLSFCSLTRSNIVRFILRNKWLIFQMFNCFTWWEKGAVWLYSRCSVEKAPIKKKNRQKNEAIIFKHVKREGSPMFYISRQDTKRKHRNSDSQTLVFKKTSTHFKHHCFLQDLVTTCLTEVLLFSATRLELRIWHCLDQNHIKPKKSFHKNRKMNALGLSKP